MLAHVMHCPFADCLKINFSLGFRAMSEALYICAGHQEQGVSLSHYGLGIDKYTHFTSPIRRYADIVVHKQLLAALTMDNIDDTLLERTSKDPRLVLDEIPDSSAISILKGEGLSGKANVTKKQPTSAEPEGFLDSLIAGASELALGSSGNDEGDDVPSQNTGNERLSVEALVPYSATDVGRICEGLNQQNRMAKLSSLECQRLFLSLYFNDHVEIGQAVVTELRTNGMIIYVPKFDLKGPLYLCDTNGDVQIDPHLVGLTPEAGLPPTLGFVNAPNYRRFPSGRCILRDSDEGGSIEVVIPEAPTKCIFCPLGVVTVQISCDLSDVRPRIPPPRFYLASAGLQKGGRSKSSEPRKVTSSMIHGGEKEPNEQCNLQGSDHDASHDSRGQSMYEQLSRMDIKPILADEPLRRRRPKVHIEAGDTNILPGRKCFGGFQNPDTRSATQEAAIAAAVEAASHRRAAAIASQSRRDEYDTTRTIERNVKARMHRLAAEKRSARRSKGK